MPDNDNLPPDFRAVVQWVVEQGQDITISQLNALLPDRLIYASELEDIVSFLDRHGLRLVEDDAPTR